MLILLQSVATEPLPGVTWPGAIAALAGAATIFGALLTAWYNRRIAEADARATAAQKTADEKAAAAVLATAAIAGAAVKAEQDRINQQMKSVLSAAAEADKATQILYMGHDPADTGAVFQALQDAGIGGPGNRIITKVSIDATMEYIQDHPGITMVLIINTSSETQANGFMKTLKGNKATSNIPVVVLDGFTDAERVGLYQGGVDAFMEHPFAVVALMAIMARLGYGSTFAKRTNE